MQFDDYNNRFIYHDFHFHFASLTLPIPLLFFCTGQWACVFIFIIFFFRDSQPIFTTSLIHKLFMYFHKDNSALVAVNVAHP